MNVGAGERRRCVMVKLNIPRQGINLKRFKFSKLSKPGRLLVFESTGFNLYGAVASRTTSSALTLGAVALSSGTDMAAAVGEVLEQLRSQSKKHLPRNAVLITPCAAGAFHSLPVNPKKPRPDVQMAELVRWELEELLVQQSELWTLGALLMGRGDISAEQRREIETKAAREQMRLGTASFAPLVASERMDESLSLQELWAGGDDTEMATGWIGLGGGDEEDGFLWSVAGIGAGIRDHWARAFAKHNIHLGWIYPRLGACLPLLNGGRDGWLLVDVLQEQTALFRGLDRQPDYQTLRPCVMGRADVEPLVEAVRDLVRPETRTVYLSAPPDQENVLLAALNGAFAHSSAGVERLVAEGTETEGVCTLSMAGVARHALGAAAKAPLVRIRAQDPPPPLWKRRELWPWAAIGLLVAGIASYETYARILTAKNKAELTRLEVEYEQQLKLKRQAEAMANEAKRLETELGDKMSQLREKERMRDILDNVIRYRQDLIPGILEAIAEAISDGIILDIVEENDKRTSVRLEGWTATDTEGQVFVSRLNEKLTPWKYWVKESKLSRGRSWLGVDGYQFNIWVVPTGDGDNTEPAARAEGKGAKTGTKKGRK